MAIITDINTPDDILLRNQYVNCKNIARLNDYIIEFDVQCYPSSSARLEDEQQTYAVIKYSGPCALGDSRTFEEAAYDVLKLNYPDAVDA